jgi:hypothetical protein
MLTAGSFIQMDCGRRMPPNSLIFVNFSAHLWQEYDAACR